MLLIALLVLRIASVLILCSIADGKALTDDSEFHLAFVADPNLLLMPREAGVYRPPFPPLQPWLMAAGVRPFLAMGFSEFVALRLGYLVYELAAWPLIWAAIGGVVRARGWQVGMGLAVIFCPLLLVSTPVLAQEESIALAFAAVVVWLALRGRLLWAAWVCGMGVVMAKVFFLLPLLAMIFGPMDGGSRDAWRGVFVRALAGLLPVVVVYGMVHLTGAAASQAVSLAGFVPPNQMCVSLWAWLEGQGWSTPWWSLHASKWLALVAVGATLAWGKRQIGVCRGEALVWLMACVTVAGFAMFSHVNPEHWLMAVPMLVVALRPLASIAVLLGLFGVQIAAAVSYSVAAASEAGSGGSKAAVVRAFERVSPLSASLTHAWLLATYLILLWVLWWWMLRRLPIKEEPVLGSDR